MLKSKACIYLTLVWFIGHVTSSISAPYQQVGAVEKQQLYIIYPPVQGETLEAVAERFSLPVSALSALRKQFQAYGWLSTSVLIPYSSEGEARLYSPYVTYQLKTGETLASVAGKFNRSARELSLLNGQLMPASKAAALKAGDFIFVPAPTATRANPTEQSSKEHDKFANTVAQEVAEVAQILGDDKRKGAATSKGFTTADMLTQRATGELTGGAAREIEKFLGENGKAKVGLQANVKTRQLDYSLDYLQPLYEREDDIVFAQIGGRTFGERNLANLGFGYRTQLDEHLVLGVNSFIDQDLSRNHTRGGVGGEAWTDLARFSSNYYTPLSGWKSSKEHRLNSDPENRILQERAAKGWDINVETGFPGVKELSLTGKYFQWNGDRVDVSGSGSRTEKDPKGYTVGAKYQPIPLLNLNAQHTKVSGGRGGWEMGLGLTWDLDKSLSEMLDPKKSSALRPLIQAKTDIVNRNYNIVLEYQEKDKYAPLTFALNSISIMAGTNDPGLRVQGGRQGLVTYSSSAPETLTVDPASGMLSALIAGTAIVTAVEQNAEGKVFGSASYTVTITPNTMEPIVNVTRIDGSLSVGSVLTGVYTFEPNGGNTTDQSSLAWLNGGHSETDSQYLLDSADVGLVLTFEVTAKNGAGIVGNTSSLKTSSMVGTQIPLVTIRDAVGNTLNGPPIIGQELKAVVECETLCNSSGFNFQWSEETFPGSGVYVEIPGGMAQTFTPQIGHQLRRVQVTAESKK
ncbi:inverse autotransporter beta domain-containing protein [Pseudomonas chlororaphis]|uniref:inverse autotransporter beta domain-containing protein n=1 Tax=Pseudomonas chlororaphis TaxID=587753 RepID=UPI0009B87F84|nr:inverse autotransporter beta domain-containing protein [Pseudomonas chlororaphis]